MFVSGNGSVNWEGMSPLRKGKAEETGSQRDGFVASGSEWKPVKPNLQAESTSSSRPLRGILGSVLMLTLGVCLAAGATGCASVATAHAAESGPKIVQVQTKQEKKETRQAQGDSLSYQVGKGLNQTGQDFRQAGKDIRDASRPALQKGKEVGQQIGDKSVEVARDVKDASQPALKKGKEIGQQIGEKGAEVGREIGKQGEAFGKGVAREAKSFWRGLTGK